VLGMERNKWFVNVFRDRIITRDIVKLLLPHPLRQFLTLVSLKHVLLFAPCTTGKLVVIIETNERGKPDCLNLENTEDEE